MIARWEQAAVAPSLETLLELVNACGFELPLELFPYDQERRERLKNNARLSPERRVENHIYFLARSGLFAVFLNYIRNRHSQRIPSQLSVNQHPLTGEPFLFRRRLLVIPSPLPPLPVPVWPLWQTFCCPWLDGPLAGPHTVPVFRG